MSMILKLILKWMQLVRIDKFTPSRDLEIKQHWSKNALMISIALL